MKELAEKSERIRNLEHQIKGYKGKLARLERHPRERYSEPDDDTSAPAPGSSAVPSAQSAPAVNLAQTQAPQVQNLATNAGRNTPVTAVQPLPASASSPPADAAHGQRHTVELAACPECEDPEKAHNPNFKREVRCDPLKGGCGAWLGTEEQAKHMHRCYSCEKSGNVATSYKGWSQEDIEKELKRQQEALQKSKGFELPKFGELFSRGGGGGEQQKAK
jgi:hypothetical protein